ncbi:MAG: hypothetical protein ABIH65_03950 [Nanoarchaeota archaeon]
MKIGFNIISEKKIAALFTLVFMFAYPVTFINCVNINDFLPKVLRQIYLSLSLFKF